MVLIIGGAYQGKLDTARKRYNIEASDICNLENDKLDLNKRVLYNFHSFVYGFMLEGGDILSFIEENTEALKDKIIISDDISQGVVPIDGDFRRWREELGRALGKISREAERVIRVFAGIETVIK